MNINIFMYIYTNHVGHLAVQIHIDILISFEFVPRNMSFVICLNSGVCMLSGIWNLLYISHHIQIYYVTSHTNIWCTPHTYASLSRYTLQCNTYRVAKTHKILYLYKLFSAKKSLELKALLQKETCNLKHPMHLRHAIPRTYHIYMHTYHIYMHMRKQSMHLYNVRVIHMFVTSHTNVVYMCIGISFMCINIAQSLPCVLLPARLTFF